jgi:hypothetical protein
MSPAYLLDKANLILTLTLQSVILVVMYRRRLQQEFRWFFGYTGFVLSSSLVLLPLEWWQGRSPAMYAVFFFSYWVQEALSIALGFAVIYEVVRKVLEPYEVFRRYGPPLFRWAAAALLLASAVVALFSPGGDAVKAAAGIFVLERSLRLVQAGLLLLVFAACAWLGISWRRPVLGVALGFGVYAATILACATVRALVGMAGASTYALITPTAYTCAVMIWAGYFVLPQAAAAPAEFVPQGAEVEKWHQALSHLLQR